MVDVDVQQLAARVQRLEDIEAIKRVIVRYAQGADRGNDTDIMIPLFTDDAVWDGGERFGVYQGTEAIRQFLSESGSFIGWTLHYMISPAIEVDVHSKTAKAFWYLWETATMPNTDTGEDDAFWIGGTYDSELIKQPDGAWKFAQIVLTLKLLSAYAEGWAKKRMPD